MEVVCLDIVEVLYVVVRIIKKIGREINVLIRSVRILSHKWRFPKSHQ